MVDEASSKVGYKINFNLYFDKPQQLMPLMEILSDIFALEKEIEGLLVEVVDKGK